MRSLSEEIRFTREHSWIEMIDEFIGRCGISHMMPDRLGQILFVEFPEIDIPVRMGERVARVESDIDIFDMLSPVTGVVVAVNNDLVDDPGLVSRDPLGRGWIFLMDVSRTSEFDELMTPSEYDVFASG